MNKPDLWWKNTIIYELYIDKFAKNIKGLISKLDYFTDLGVDTLWLLPHYPSPMVDDGYDISDYKNVRPELGTLKDFETLINEAHKRNIKVITDMVLNHSSDKHPWFIEAKSSKSNKYRDYYLWSETGKELAQAKNSFENIKPKNWIKNEHTNDYYFATFYPQQPDLNWDNQNVLENMMDNIKFWLNMGVDGLRLDAIVHLIKRENSQSVALPETHEVVKKIRKFVDKTAPNTVLIAEAGLPTNQTKDFFGSGDECHMAFNFMLSLKTWLYLKDGDIGVLNNEIAEGQDIPENCQWATFLTNHDAFGLWMLDEKDKKSLGDWLDADCHFSHKVGSKTAMRIAEIFCHKPERIVEAFKVLLDMPGSPVIYYGEEIGMRNAQLKVKPLDTRLYVRGDFDWEDAEKQMKDTDSIFNSVKKLIANKRG